MLVRQIYKGVGRGWSWKGVGLPCHKQWEPFRKHWGYPDKLGTGDVLPSKPIIKWRSQKCTRWGGRRAARSQSSKGWKKETKNVEASRKPIKDRTDFAVITYKLPHKGSWGIFTVSG